MTIAISPAIVITIVVYAGLAGSIFCLVLYRKPRRLSLRQRPIPHTPIGEDSFQNMKEEIKAQLLRVKDIKVEPRFLTIEDTKSGEIVDDLRYRMIAVDSMRSLDRMVKEILPAWERQKSQTVRQFMFLLQRCGGPLSGCPEVCAALLDSYERARYGCQLYNEDEYQEFLDLLMDINNRLSILNPEEFNQGPESYDINEADVIKWLQAPPQCTPEFTRLSKKDPRRSETSSDRDLIELSRSGTSEHLADTSIVSDRRNSIEILQSRSSSS